jgi:hypothetical protein
LNLAKLDAALSKPYALVMRKGSSKSSELNRLAASIVQDAMSEPVPEKNPAAVALGRLGGLKGGPARAASLSAAKRKQIAKKAAEARWRK